MNDWQRDARQRLEKAGIDQPEIEAERILQTALGQGESPEEKAEIMLNRRLQGEPLEFILGSVRFMDIDMIVEPGALIPRKETEILAAGMTSRLKTKARESLRIIDMCCGAGNLACYLAKAFPHALVWASDLTEATVRLAQKNVELLGLSDRVKVGRGDLFEGLEGWQLEGTIHAIVCNPPYISTGRLDKDRAQLLDHEPVEAFDGGPYGLTIHQRVIKEAIAFLEPGGLIGFEIGLGQERQIELLFRRSKQYDPVVFDTDEQDRPRAAFAFKKDE